MAARLSRNSSEDSAYDNFNIKFSDFNFSSWVERRRISLKKFRFDNGNSSSSNLSNSIENSNSNISGIINSNKNNNKRDGEGMYAGVEKDRSLMVESGIAVDNADEDALWDKTRSF